MKDALKWAPSIKFFKTQFSLADHGGTKKDYIEVPYSPSRLSTGQYFHVYRAKLADHISAETTTA